MHWKIYLISNPLVMIEMGNALKSSLEELGNTAEVITDESKIGGHADGNIVIKAFRPFPINSITGLKILFQTEELWNRREKGVYDLSAGWHRVLEMYHENTIIPKGTENVVHCPVGYSTAFGDVDETIKEDIDVYFYGSITPRRATFYPILKEAGFHVVFDENVFGKERDDKIRRSKIVINLKAHDMWSYAPIHCLLAQAKGKFTLVEQYNSGDEPYTPGKHFDIFTNTDELVKKIEYWLSHEKERKEFALSALEDMRKNCLFTPILAEALRGI